MSIGVYLPVSHPRGLPHPRTIVDYAREAENFGFDGLWAGDHLLWRTPLLEPTTALAAAAGATSRVTVGTNVYLLGLRPPLLTAKVFGTLAYLAGNRLILGVGVGGEFPDEFEGLRIPLEGRGVRLDRALAEVHEWWGFGERAGRVTPAPDSLPPLWVGGRSEASLRRAVRERAQAWTVHFSGPERIAAMATRLAELADEADAPTPAVAVTLNINIGNDGGGEARAFSEAHFGLPFDRISRHVISGDMEACLERVLAFSDVADHLVFFPCSFDLGAQLGLLAELSAEIRYAWSRTHARGAGA